MRFRRLPTKRDNPNLSDQIHGRSIFGMPTRGLVSAFLFGVFACAQWKRCVSLLSNKALTKRVVEQTTEPLPLPTSLEEFRIQNANYLRVRSERYDMGNCVQRRGEESQYTPAEIERYILQSARELGFGSEEDPSGCYLWDHPADHRKRDEKETNGQKVPVVASDHMQKSFSTFVKELRRYGKKVRSFRLPQNVTSLVQELRTTNDHHTTCSMVNTNIESAFTSLSHSRSGWVEPLLPPLRHPEICVTPGANESMFDLSYLLHDWKSMCERLTPYSRIVFLDMGASLDYHTEDSQPAIYLTELYRKFGFPFDHIYAYEIKPTEPTKVFTNLPDHMQAAYHWINIGVNPIPGNHNNPLTMLKENFGPDDVVIVKLDVDNSPVEMQLAWQLLSDPELHCIVDHFYFEHHVHLLELSKWWGKSAHGSVMESLDLFSGLRNAGIGSHYWV